MADWRQKTGRSIADPKRIDDRAMPVRYGLQSRPGDQDVGLVARVVNPDKNAGNERHDDNVHRPGEVHGVTSVGSADGYNSHPRHCASCRTFV